MRVEANVAEAWGIVHAHGGVVMAAMLHAAELALGRTDFRMTSASAMFCRPVPCGPVMVDVDILRNGRRMGAGGTARRFGKFGLEPVL